MLKEDKEVLDRENRRADRSKKKSMEISGKKGMWQDANVDSGDEVRNCCARPRISDTLKNYVPCDNFVMGFLTRDEACVFTHTACRPLLKVTWGIGDVKRRTLPRRQNGGQVGVVYGCEVQSMFCRIHVMTRSHTHPQCGHFQLTTGPIRC